MKNLLLIACFIFVSSVNAQQLRFGIEISPSYKIQSYRNKTTTLRSSKSGYGFSFGLPVKYALNGDNTLSTGLIFDYSAFDTYQNNNLVSFIRTTAVQLPIEFNQVIMDNWYANFGAGLTYNLTVRQNNFGIANDISFLTNNFQPFASLGVSTILNRGDHDFELGIKSRYFILDFWKNNAQTATHNIYFDVQMKYYF